MKIYFDQYVRNALYDKGGYYHDHSSVKEKGILLLLPKFLICLDFLFPDIFP